MTVAVNQPPPRDNDLDTILKAVNVATSIYGAKLDRQRAARLEELAQKELEAKKTSETTKNAKETEQAALNFNEKWAPAKPNDPEAATLKIPGSDQTGLFIPRSVLGDRNKTAFDAAKLADTKSKDGKKANEEAGYRFTNLLSNAEKLKQKIKDVGTVELFGGDSTKMDSLIYEMAIDYAKLVDPESIAREGEVAAAQKYMLPVRNWGGFGMSNATAEKVVDDYVKGINDRMNSRSIAQGKEPPAGNPGTATAKTPAIDPEAAREELRRRGLIK